MKRIILILTFFLIFINSSVFGASDIVKKEIIASSVDGFRISATLEYPKTNSKNYNTVVLLHSLGYSSEWWEDLPETLLNEGFAILKVDLRGHGKSVYNSKLTRTSWKNMTNSAYAKYPDDIIKVMKQIKYENPKKEFFDNWAIVGADIGGSAGILASEKLTNKPKTIVLLSPVVETKGLFIPVKFANLNGVDIFSISGTNDVSGDETQEYLRKFAQAAFSTYTSSSASNGMLMLKNDEGLTHIISSWIEQYLK